jgi:3-methyladenine DNA glycosylase Tag
MPKSLSFEVRINNGIVESEGTYTVSLANDEDSNKIQEILNKESIDSSEKSMVIGLIRKKFNDQYRGNYPEGIGNQGIIVKDPAIEINFGKISIIDVKAEAIERETPMTETQTELLEILRKAHSNYEKLTDSLTLKDDERRRTANMVMDKVAVLTGKFERGETITDSDINQAKAFAENLSKTTPASSEAKTTAENKALTPEEADNEIRNMKKGLKPINLTENNLIDFLNSVKATIDSVDNVMKGIKNKIKRTGYANLSRELKQLKADTDTARAISLRSNEMTYEQSKAIEKQAQKTAKAMDDFSIANPDVKLPTDAKIGMETAYVGLRTARNLSTLSWGIKLLNKAEWTATMTPEGRRSAKNKEAFGRLDKLKEISTGVRSGRALTSAEQVWVNRYAEHRNEISTLDADGKYEEANAKRVAFRREFIEKNPDIFQKSMQFFEKIIEDTLKSDSISPYTRAILEIIRPATQQLKKESNTALLVTGALLTGIGGLALFVPKALELTMRYVVWDFLIQRVAIGGVSAVLGGIIGGVKWLESDISKDIRNFQLTQALFEGKKVQPLQEREELYRTFSITEQKIINDPARMQAIRDIATNNFQIRDKEKDLEKLNSQIIKTKSTKNKISSLESEIKEANSTIMSANIIIRAIDKKIPQESRDRIKQYEKSQIKSIELAEQTKLMDKHLEKLETQKAHEGLIAGAGLGIKFSQQGVDTLEKLAKNAAKKSTKFEFGKEETPEQEKKPTKGKRNQ